MNLGAIRLGLVVIGVGMVMSILFGEILIVGMLGTILCLIGGIIFGGGIFET